MVQYVRDGSHCVKSVRLRSYSGPRFPEFGLNTQRYGLSVLIQSECGKMRTRIIPKRDAFHAVLLMGLLFTNDLTLCWESLDEVIGQKEK